MLKFLSFWYYGGLKEGKKEILGYLLRDINNFYFKKKNKFYYYLRYKLLNNEMLLYYYFIWKGYIIWNELMSVWLYVLFN